MEHDKQVIADVIAAMPTEMDRKIAHGLSPCWHSTSDTPDATCDAVGDSDRCDECRRADEIAALLGAVRAHERQACAALCDAICLRRVDGSLPGDDAGNEAAECAEAIRARGCVK